MAVNMPPTEFIIRVLCERERVTCVQLRAIWSRVAEKTLNDLNPWAMDLSDKAISSALAELERCCPGAIRRDGDDRDTVVRFISPEESKDWFRKCVFPKDGTYNDDDFRKDKAVAFDKFVRDALEQDCKSARPLAASH